MRATRGYDTFEEFEREELCAKRNNAWTIAELVDDFTIVEELDLDRRYLTRRLSDNRRPL